MRPILIPIILLMLQSCDTVRRDYERLAGSQIIFPHTLQRIDGRDTVPFVLSENKNRLLIYHDSASCQTCAISKLSDWDSFIDSAKMICEDLELVFVISPSRKEYKRVLKEIMIGSPRHNVAFDGCGSFAEHNPQIPRDSRLHIMLLDKSNRVVVIGDPLCNPMIGSLTLDALRK